MMANDNLTIKQVISGWSPEDLSNLWFLLTDEQRELVPSLSAFSRKFGSLYHSPLRKSLEAGLSAVDLPSKIEGAIPFVRGFQAGLRGPENENNENSVIIPDTAISESGKGDNLHSQPTYTEILIEAAKFRRVYDISASRGELERYLSDDIIIQALSKMKPKERMTFFHHTVHVDDVLRKANIQSNGIHAPIALTASLGLAQTSGFGIYMGATTALGFLTHAVGLTLPFSVYMGLSSTIAFAIGPPGFIAAGLWGAWKLSGPNWKRLIPALIYIAAVNARRSLQSESLDYL